MGPCGRRVRACPAACALSHFRRAARKDCAHALPADGDIAHAVRAVEGAALAVAAALLSSPMARAAEEAVPYNNGEEPERLMPLAGLITPCFLPNKGLEDAQGTSRLPFPQRTVPRSSRRSVACCTRCSSSFSLPVCSTRCICAAGEAVGGPGCRLLQRPHCAASRCLRQRAKFATSTRLASLRTGKIDTDALQGRWW